MGAATVIASGVTWSGQTNGTGAANASWDNGISNNWAAVSTASAVSNGTAVTFNDTNAVAGAAITNSTVTVAAGGVTPTSTTFNNSAVNYTVGGGGIGGTGGLTMSGSGTVTLSGANTYTGATTVSAGVLAVNGSLANTSTTVGNTGTLQGSGSIGGSVTVQNGGTLAAGNSIESLGTGTLTLDADSIFAYEIDKSVAPGVSGDLTFITGNFNPAGTNDAILTLTELGITGSWNLGDRLTLISYTGTWNGGLFEYLGNILNDDTTFTFSGISWLFNYNDSVEGDNFTTNSSGTFVTMTAVPEPNVAALLGVLALLRRRR